MANKDMTNQHKRMAMGEKITGMKNGGMACMKKGGMVKKGDTDKKKGGMVKKKK